MDPFLFENSILSLISPFLPLLSSSYYLGINLMMYLTLSLYFFVLLYFLEHIPSNLCPSFSYFKFLSSFLFDPENRDILFLF